MRGGRGDCAVCVTDEKNKECAGYRPIAFFVFQVKGESNAEPLSELSSCGRAL